MTKNLKLSVFYILIFLSLCVIHLSLFNYAYDDAYIHFRIAENFLLYGKPYFNLDEKVMASSSPGWTLTLLALFFMTGVKLKAVSIFNAAVTALAVYVYARVVDEAVGVGKTSHDALVALALLPILAYSNIGLMETSLALLLLGTGVLLYLRKNSVAFLFFGISVFFRLELAVFVSLFLAFNAYRKAVPVWKSCLYSALGAAPFIAYAYYYFGTIIPQPVRAKPVVFLLSRADVIELGVPGFFFEGSKGTIIESVLLAMLSYIVFRTALKYRHRFEQDVILLLLSGSVLIFLTYFFKKTYICNWYLPLYYAPFFLSSLIYVLDKRSALLGASLIAAFLPVGANFCITAYASVFDKSAYPIYSYEARVQKYLEVGRRLYERYPDYTLMTSEIGGLGFAFKGKVYDGVGLISEGALKYHPMKVPEQRPTGDFGSIPAGYIKEIQPDIIVSYDVYMDGLITPDVLDKYVRIKDDIYAPEDLKMLRDKGPLPGKLLSILIKKGRYTRGY